MVLCLSCNLTENNTFLFLQLYFQTNSSLWEGPYSYIGESQKKKNHTELEGIREAVLNDNRPEMFSGVSIGKVIWILV